MNSLFLVTKLLGRRTGSAMAAFRFLSAVPFQAQNNVVAAVEDAEAKD